jgi:PAS domain S-box-containing protein
MINPFELSVASNDAFREIFQSMTEGIVVVDAEGKILVSNPIADEMFAYSPHEMVGMQMEELLPERYRGKHMRFRAGFNEHPAPRRMGQGRDLTALRKDGHEFPVEISLSYSKAGGNFMAIAFITDISQRKKSEEALKQSEEQLIVYAAELERKVKERTEDLNTSVIKLEREVAERKKAEEEARKSLEKERELNELKSKFVSIASHEFRTPLSAILSSISLVVQYKERGEIDKIDKHAMRIKSSVNHLTGILNDFLSLGKLEEGKVDVGVDKVNLKELFEDIIEESKMTLKEGQQIELECKAKDGSLATDSRILRNILFNLLSNASKYSQSGKSIKLICIENEKEFQISVADQGIGIPPGDHKHLFDRFFRASNAGNVQGTGLGLNIVTRYLALLNGKIDFTSTVGVGTTFTITLPKGQ